MLDGWGESHLIPNQGPNEHKLELPKPGPAAALTVNPSPSPPALLVPGG